LLRPLSAVLLRLRTVACLFVAAGAISGCSVSAGECQTAAKCNELGGESASQCTTAGDKCIAQLQEAAGVCGDLANAIIEYDNCAASLSCSDRTPQNLNTGNCMTQYGDMLGAAENALAGPCAACGTSVLMAPDGGS